MIAVNTTLDTVDLNINPTPNDWDAEATGGFPNIAFRVVDRHTGFPAVFFGRVEAATGYQGSPHYPFLLEKLDRNFVLKTLANAVGELLYDLNQKDEVAAYVIQDESSYVSVHSYGIQGAAPHHHGEELRELYRGATTLYPTMVVEPSVAPTNYQQGNVRVLPGLWVSCMPVINGAQQAPHRPPYASAHDEFYLKFADEATFMLRINPTLVSHMTTGGQAVGETLEWLTGEGVIDQETFFETVIKSLVEMSDRLKGKEAIVYLNQELVYEMTTSEE